jgi:DNA-binding NtrC family response regulator
VGRCAEADGGTLALDEIGTLRPEMQAKLLRFLETGEYQVIGESKARVANARVIAITNEELGASVKSGEFRADLFYRLNVFPIEVPPLRRRKEDVPALAVYFASRARGGRSGAASVVLPVAPGALEILAAYDWPGNVRELRNVMERAVILAGNDPIDGALIRSILGDPRRPSALDASDEDLHLRRRVENLEKSLISEALSRVGGKKREAASLLGIDPKNLAYYLKKHGMGEGLGDSPEDSTP